MKAEDVLTSKTSDGASVLLKRLTTKLNNYTTNTCVAAVRKQERQLW